MPTVTKFDEINKYEESRTRHIPYKQYFEELPISDEAIQKRIKLANELDDIFFYLFAMMAAMRLLEKSFEEEAEYLSSLVARQYYDSLVICGYDVEDGYEFLKVHVDEVSKEIVNATIKHIDYPYFTSDDRAMFISENEAHTILNTIEENEAIKDGFTTKTWVTMRDALVRHTHVIADGETVGIFDTFDIGGYPMRFPKDDSLGASASEIVNCRCCLVYGGRTQTKILED